MAKSKKYENAPNIKNKDSSLFKKLTKIFSGPLVTYRSKIVAKHRGKDVEKYGKKFNSLSNNSYRRESYFYDATRTHMLAIQTRMERYIDFDQMEFDPLLSSALDYYADEITTYSDYSKMLNVDCSNDEIKIILETLFYDVLAVESNLFHWVRSFPVKYDSIIPLLDNRELTIEEISKKYQEEVLWTYAVQDKTGKIVPGKITWCGKRPNPEKIWKVTLDDGTCIETTRDHSYILRDGTVKRAEQLIVGDSLMPLYTKKSQKKKGTRTLDGYELVYNPEENKFRYTHRLTVTDSWERGSIVHHKDFCKLNNSPDNLQFMNYHEHTKFHSGHCKEFLHNEENTKKRLAGIQKFLRSDARKNKMSKKMSGIYPEPFKKYNSSESHKKHNIIRSESLSRLWKEKPESMKEKITIKFDQSCFNFIVDKISERGTYISQKEMCKLLKGDIDFLEYFKQLNKNYSKKSVETSLTELGLLNLIRRFGFNNYADAVLFHLPNMKQCPEYVKTLRFKNHSVSKIEVIEDLSDVYCMTIVGPNGEEDRHNFPICGRKEDGSYSRESGVFVENCKYGDFFLYLDIDENIGIKSVIALPTVEVERIEGEDETNPNYIQFKWNAGGLVFEYWQIAHFRNLGNDKFNPYGQCLKYDSKILTKDGIKEIKNISEFDYVISYDLKSNKKIECPVKKVIHSGKKDCYKIRTRHCELEASKEHKIAVMKQHGNVEYKFVSDLQIGDLLIQLSLLKNEDVFVEQIISIEKTGNYDVYDICLDDENHNFFANNILVHNSALDGARRIFRQLIMMEDSMMSYRVSRSSEKRVWKVEVGGIDEKDIPNHMQAFMSNIKRHQVIDPDTGRVDLRFNPASIEEDYFLPVIAGQGTNVETLPAGNNVTAIDDIKYLKSRMLAAIKIPEQYLAATEGGTQDQTTLAQKDIHFARTIQRLQQCVIAELEKIARIHLFTLGFRGDDLLNFELKLNNPSKISQMQELEALRTKLDIAGQAKSLGTFSNRWIGQNIFTFSEEELERIERERFYDKRIDAEIEASIKDIGGEPSGEDAALGGGGGPIGGGSSGDSALGGDLSGMAGDLSTEPDDSVASDKPELPKPEDDKAVDKDQPLLVAPAIDNDKGASQTVIRNSDGTVKHINLDGTIITPRSKGKAYKPTYSDKRKGAGIRRKTNPSKSNLAGMPRRSLFGNSLGFLKPRLSESEASFKLLQERIRTIKENSSNSIYHELEKEFEILESSNYDGENFDEA